jgi:hypothetical protein
MPTTEMLSFSQQLRETLSGTVVTQLRADRNLSCFQTVRKAVSEKINDSTSGF